MNYYKITFNLKSPISFSAPIMFDGVLSYAYAKDILGDGFWQKLNYSQNEIIDFSPMPLVMNSDYFMASWMIYDQKDTVTYTETWKKRWNGRDDDLADFGSRKRKIRINNGAYKSYNDQIQVFDIPVCYFFFQSDNVDEVERLINNHVVGIGKKIAQGYGIVDCFVIERLNYNPFDGQIIRPIPVNSSDLKILPNQVMQYIGYKPPYWLPSNQGLCVVK